MYSSFNWLLQYVGVQLIPVHNCPFSIHPLRKSNFLSLSFTTHIPNRGEQMVRYYGFYSNKSRELRKKAGTDDDVPALTQSAVSPKEFRRTWARLIQKIYNVDPLLCPKCLGSMKIISFIEDQQLVKKILNHLGLWETRNHDPPAKRATHIPEFIHDDSYSQLPSTNYWLQ